MNKIIKRILGAAVVINLMVAVWLFDDWILAFIRHL